MKAPIVIPRVIPEPLNRVAGTGGGCGKVIVIFATFNNDTVVCDTPIVIAHGRIFDLMGVNLGHIPDIDPLKGL
jgi:hypothetical protein